LGNIGYQGEIYIISPFKSVASYCEEFRNDKKYCVNNTQISGKKEADIVFLVLGSDPKSTGQEITSPKPNMLNVAIY
jgi:hypothetical protein